MVSSGRIHTDIHVSDGDPECIERLKNAIPIGRDGYPEEVTGTILWLLPTEAPCFIGVLLDIAGGDKQVYKNDCS